MTKKVKPLGAVNWRNRRLIIRRNSWAYRCLRWIPFGSRLCVTACRVGTDVQSFVHVERVSTLMRRMREVSLKRQQENNHV